MNKSSLLVPCKSQKINVEKTNLLHQPLQAIPLIILVVFCPPNKSVEKAAAA